MADNRASSVSILMPCLNAGKTLGDTVSSVRAQDHEEWELIIADDGSDDGSAEVVQALASEDSRIKYLPWASERSGAAKARNRALGYAQGRYIAFLDADDSWRPHKLSTQLDVMTTENVPFCCSAYEVRQPGRVAYTRHVPRQMTRGDLLKGNKIGCLTAIYDSEQLGKQPMPDIRMRHDYALWLHLLTLTPVVIGINTVLADHHRRSGSLSSNPLQATFATWKMLKDQAGLGLLGATGATVLHATRRFWNG